MPMLLVIAALVTVGAGQAQLPADLVTVGLRATRLEPALEELGRLAKVDLECDPQLANDVVAVRANQLPSSEVLTKLSDALHASWKPTARGFKLTRADNVQRDLQAQDFNERRKLIDADIESRKARLSLLKTPEERAAVSVRSFARMVEGFHSRVGVYRGGFNPEYNGPVNQLLDEALVLIGASDIAKIPPYECVVYSSKATQSQRSLPGLADAIKRYAQTTEAYNAIDTPPVEVDEYFNRLWNNQRQKLPSDGLGKVLVFVARFPTSYLASISIYTRGGKQFAFAGFSPPYISTRPRRQNKSTRSELLSLNGIAAEWHTMMPKEVFAGESSWSGPPMQMSETLGQFLANPESHDPLSLSVTDALFAIAGTKPFVGVLSDGLIDVARRATSNGKLDLRKFAEIAEQEGLMEIEVGSWVVAKPPNTAFSETYRLSREALGGFVRAALRDKAITLRNQAILYWNSELAAREGVLDELVTISLVAARLAEAPSRWIGGPQMAFLGSLTDVQWLGLSRGVSIDISMLSLRQRNLLEKELASWVRACEPRGSEMIPDLLLTGTECMPKGCPSPTPLALKLVAQTVVKNAVPVESGLMSGFNSATSAEGLASLLAGYRLDKVPYPDEVARNLFHVGQRELMTFEINVAPQVVVRIRTNGRAQFAPSDPPRRMADFPKGFQEELEREIQNAIGSEPLGLARARFR